MPAATRIGDLTVTPCTKKIKGINTTGSSNVFINNISCHRLTDKGTTGCAPSILFTSVQGSPNVFVNNLAKTRIGDTIICDICTLPGVHVTGSPNVFVNG